MTFVENLKWPPKLLNITKQKKIKIHKPVKTTFPGNLKLTIFTKIIERINKEFKKR